MSKVKDYIRELKKYEVLKKECEILLQRKSDFRDTVLEPLIDVIDNKVIEHINNPGRYFIDRQNGLYGELIIRDKKYIIGVTDIRKDLPLKKILSSTGLSLSRSHREEIRLSFNLPQTVDTNGPFDDMMNFASSWAD